MSLNINLLGNLTFDELIREAEATENALALEIAKRVERGEVPAMDKALNAAYDEGYRDGDCG